MIYFLIFFFGASLGSFAVLLADRLRVRSFINSRSECDSCAKKLSFWELFPIISFLIQRGRCFTCKVRLPFKYICFETLTGILVLFSFITAFSLNYSLISKILIFLISCFVITCSITIILYDLKHKVIPLEITFVLIVLGAILTILRQYYLGFNIFDFLSGFIVALPFILLYVVSSGRWLGIGDILIYFAFGSILGLPFGITMFLYSIWIGGFISILLLIFQNKDYNLKSELPFTPFIILAAALVWFLQKDLLNLYVSLY